MAAIVLNLNDNEEKTVMRVCASVWEDLNGNFSK